MEVSRFAACCVLLGLLLLASGCMSSGPAAADAADPAVTLGFVTVTPTGTAPAPAVAPGTPEPPAPADGGQAPEATVSSFYDWYLNYLQDQGDPLADGAYRDSEYLDPGFVAQIDKAVASFAPGANDPFLCAPSAPSQVDVGPAAVTDSQATVPVQAGPDSPPFQVLLAPDNSRWLITGIECSTDPPRQKAALTGAVPPEQVVQSFYDWYLLEARNVDTPITRESFKTSPYLTPNAVQTITQIWTGFGDGPRYDPILCAQSVPVSVTVEPSEPAGDEARVFVRMQWDGSPSTSQTVSLKLVDGEWKIDGFTCAIENPTPVPDGVSPQTAAPSASEATASWQIYRDTGYGYEIRYPKTWVSFIAMASGLVASGEGTLQSVIGFAPGTASEDVAAISIEVYEGTEEQLSQAFNGAGTLDQVTINGYEALFGHRNPDGNTSYYVFPMPGNHTQRLVVYINSNAAQSIEDFDSIAAQMLSTLRFTG